MSQGLLHPVQGAEQSLSQPGERPKKAVGGAAVRFHPITLRISLARVAHIDRRRLSIAGDPNPEAASASARRAVAFGMIRPHLCLAPICRNRGRARPLLGGGLLGGSARKDSE